jgi:hypothetical protein
MAASRAARAYKQKADEAFQNALKSDMDARRRYAAACAISARECREALAKCARASSRAASYAAICSATATAHIAQVASESFSSLAANAVDELKQRLEEETAAMMSAASDATRIAAAAAYIATSCSDEALVTAALVAERHREMRQQAVMAARKAARAALRSRKFADRTAIYCTAEAIFAADFANWTEQYDSSRMRHYYVNSQTGTSQIAKPKVIQQIDSSRLELMKFGMERVMEQNLWRLKEQRRSMNQSHYNRAKISHDLNLQQAEVNEEGKESKSANFIRSPRARRKIDLPPVSYSEIYAMLEEILGSDWETLTAVGQIRRLRLAHERRRLCNKAAARIQAMVRGFHERNVKSRARRFRSPSLMYTSPSPTLSPKSPRTPRLLSPRWAVASASMTPPPGLPALDKHLVQGRAMSKHDKRSIRQRMSAPPSTESTGNQLSRGRQVASTKGLASYGSPSYSGPVARPDLKMLSPRAREHELALRAAAQHNKLPERLRRNKRQRKQSSVKPGSREAFLKDAWSRKRKEKEIEKRKRSDKIKRLAATTATGKLVRRPKNLREKKESVRETGKLFPPIFEYK